MNNSQLNKSGRLFLVCCTAICISSLAASAWTKKQVSSEWTWCETYFYAYAKYTVACEPGRDCQVGMGIFAFDQPRGEKIGFTGQREITVIGFGALYMRAADGKGPVTVALSQTSSDLIKTTPIPW